MIFADGEPSILGIIGAAITSFLTAGGIAALFRYLEKRSTNAKIAESEENKLKAHEAEVRAEEAAKERDAVRDQWKKLADRYERIIQRQQENDERMAHHLQEIQDRYTEKSNECATLRALNQTLAEQLQAERAKRA